MHDFMQIRLLINFSISQALSTQYSAFNFASSLRANRDLFGGKTAHRQAIPEPNEVFINIRHN